MDKPKGYRDLDIFILAEKLAVEIHKMTMTLPKHECYEEGSQIRRSSKAIAVSIAEGFGRRNYKNEFVHFLTLALAECDETHVHLDFLHKAQSLSNKEQYDYLVNEYNKLGRMLNRFLSAVRKYHKSEK